MPRLIFSDSDHLNTNISDEQGHKLYTISTPGTFNKVTTITKYLWHGSTGSPQTLGVIEWHSSTGDIIRFQGREIRADLMLEERPLETGRHFVGPDKKAYKWKFEADYCWLRSSDSYSELARSQQRNIGIGKEYHPSSLTVSSQAVPILDHIILTFVYVEKLRKDPNGGALRPANRRLGL